MSKTTIEAQIEEVNARADRFMKHFKVKENGHLQTDYHGLMEFVKKEVELALTTQKEEVVEKIRKNLEKESVTIAGEGTIVYLSDIQDVLDDVLTPLHN